MSPLATDTRGGRMPDKRDKTPISDQGRTFIEKARELGCDEDPAAFDRMFERIVPPRRKPQTQPSEKRDEAPKGRRRR